MTSKGYKLTPKQKEELMWDLVAGVKTGVLIRKYGINKTTVQYYRNPTVHKARLKRFYDANKKKLNAESRSYHAKNREVINKKKRRTGPK